MTKARSNAVANAAKGDLTVGNGTDLSGILAVGSNGDTLVADSSTSTGLRYTGNFAAGKNKLINANMVIDQRNSGASVTLTASAPYLVDRWIGIEDTDGGMTAQQDSSAPTGFAKSLKFTTTTADATLSAAQQTRTQQFIEGNNIAEFSFGTASAKTVTLSFWVRSSLTGTFAGSLRDYNATRSYVFNYSISAANTWEYKTVTIAGDTSGTWATDSAGGAAVIFNLGSGSNYQGTANTWSAGNFFTTSGATSVIGTLNATWYVTGVQLEIGSVATAFQTMTGNIQGELAACQRYYTRLNYQGSGSIAFGYGIVGNSTAAQIFVPLPVSMRPGSLLTIDYSSLRANDYNNAYTISAITNASTFSGGNGQIVQITSTGMTQYRVIGLDTNSSGYIGFSAEL
jgi:hypothetical protein